MSAPQYSNIVANIPHTQSISGNIRHQPSKQFYSGPELDLSWQNFVPVMGQYSQTNMPESALFWPSFDLDIRNTYRLLFGYICRANTGPDTIIEWLYNGYERDQ